MSVWNLSRVLLKLLWVGFPMSMYEPGPIYYDFSKALRQSLSSWELNGGLGWAI